MMCETVMSDARDAGEQPGKPSTLQCQQPTLLPRVAVTALPGQEQLQEQHQQQLQAHTGCGCSDSAGLGCSVGAALVPRQLFLRSQQPVPAAVCVTSTCRHPRSIPFTQGFAGPRHSHALRMGPEIWAALQTTKSVKSAKAQVP